jgi:streptogramin lyase
MSRANRSFSVQGYLRLPLLLSALFLSFSSAAPSQIAERQSYGSLQGTVHIGSGIGNVRRQADAAAMYKPAVGATVKLFQVGTTGYGSAPTLLAQTVTGTGGSWNIATFTCSPDGAEVYLVASGGSTGLSANPGISLMSFLGPCNALPRNVIINEVTTVASVWALAQFMKPFSVGNVGSPSTNTLGLANAARTVANLATVATGRAPGNLLPIGATAPVAKINTLANIAAACIQSLGVSSPECQGLFTAATPAAPNNVKPTDTLTALLDIASNPVHNASALFTLSSANQQFTPVLAAAPTDWTLAVNFTGGGLDSPNSIAVDSLGNIWATNPSSSTVSKFSPGGVALSGAGFTGGGLSSPQSLAVDHTGHIWVANAGNNSLTELSASGTPMTNPLQVIGGGLSFPQKLVIDTFDNIWIANCGDACNGSGKAANLSKFTSAGAALSPANGFTGGGLNASKGLALDALGNLWIANEGTNSISKFSTAGVAVSPVAGYTGGGLLRPVSITVDAGAKVWMSNPPGDSISSFNLSGVALSSSTGTIGGGLSGPRGIASDSAANKWIATNHGAAEFDAAGNVLSPSTGFADSKSNSPQDIAIDNSGNVWIANRGDGSLANSTLSEFIGTASPVMTPVFGPPGAAFDNMINANGYFSFIVVRTISPGNNVSNPPGYLKPTATANGNGTVTVAVLDSHSDTTEEIIDYRLPGALSNPYISLATNRFLQFHLTSINPGHFYNANILFFGPGTNPTFLKEVVWLSNSTNLNPTLDVNTLAPSGAAQYFLRYRLFPFNVPGNVFTIDSITTSP